MAGPLSCPPPPCLRGIPKGIVGLKIKGSFRRNSPSSSFSFRISCSVDAMAKEVEKQKKEVKLWGGRFQDSVTDAVEKFSESVSYDKRFYKQDIDGSRAHASMLAQQGYGLTETTGHGPNSWPIVASQKRTDCGLAHSKEEKNQARAGREPAVASAKVCGFVACKPSMVNSWPVAFGHNSELKVEGTH